MDHEEFERLNLEEQERIFHQTPFNERGYLLLYSHDPARLAQSLSQEELYLMTREMDLEERSEVIRYANLPQLFFISDVECWKKDRLNLKAFVRWLETLQQADEQRLLAWLVEMDYETVVTGFRGLIQVLKPEWEYAPDEVLGDRPYFTLDERYYISVKEENLETVRRAIEILFENHRGRYTAILEGILGELDYEIEENAFQNRGRRLAERGFPDPETAYHIYRPLSKEEYDRFPRKNSAEQKSEKIPHYLVLRSSGRIFLDEVLLLFREDAPEVRENLEEELAWLSNKVIACDGIDFASEERVKRGVERARQFVSLGLEDLSGRDLFRGREILKEKWLELVFRWGFTRALKLKEGVRETIDRYWDGQQKYFLEFLDAPYGSIFRGLLQSVPQCHDPLVTDSVDRLRDFRTLEDIERTWRAVRQITKIHEWLAREFPPIFQRLGVEFIRKESEASLFSLLGAVFAAFVVNGKVSSHALSEREFSQFLKEGFETHGPRRILNKGLTEKFRNQFFRGPDQELLKPFWSLLFERLEEELARLSPGRDIDPRFVTSLLLAERQKRKMVHEAD